MGGQDYRSVREVLVERPFLPSARSLSDELIRREAFCLVSSSHNTYIWHSQSPRQDEDHTLFREAFVTNTA